MNNEQKHVTEEPLGTATPTAPTSEPSGTPTPWPWWQRLWRWMLGIVAGVVALVLLLAVLLYIPPVQNWVAKTAASQLSATLGYTIEVGQVRIGFPLQLRLKNISAWEGEKEVARLGYLTANASLLGLIKGGAIPVSDVTLGGVVLDFAFPSDSLFLQGHLDEVAVNRLRFDTQSSLLEVDHFKASHGNVRITILTDSTTVEEPPTEPSPLVIKIKRAKIEELASQVVLPTSGTLIDARIIKGDIAGGEVNLKGAFYQAERLEMEAWLGSVGADISFLPMPWHAKVKGKEVRYGGANDIKADIEELYYKVGDGWEVQEARLKVQKDSVQMRVPLIDITLPQSHIYGKALLPFEEWIPATKGEVEVDLRGQLNPSEVDRFVGGLSGIPQELYALTVKGEGAMEEELNVELSLSNPQVLALELQAKGNKVLSGNEGTLTANYTLTSHQMAMQRASQLIRQGEEATPAPRWTIPSALQLRGKAEWKKGQGSTDFFLTSPQGHLLGYLQYHPKRKAYKGTLDVRELNLQQFLPADSLATLSATVQLEGRGTDPMNPATEASLYAQIDSIQYKHTTLNQLMLLSRLSKSNLFGALNLGDEALKLTAQVDAHLAKADVQGSVNLFLDTIIPSQLGLNIPIIEGAKLELRGHIRSDLKEFYDFDGELENFWIQTDRNTIQPANTYVVASTSDSLMYGEVTSGDLSLMVDIENGLNDFTDRIKKLTQEVKASFADSLGTLDMAPWMQYYPTMKVDLSMGRNNLLRAYLDEHRIGARSARLSLRTTTAEGLSGEGVVSYFQMDTFRIDNMDLVLRQDPSFFYGFASVHKERFRNQLPFTIVSSITTNVQRSELYLHWTDHHGDDFVQLGLEMWNHTSGDITLGFTPDPLILLHNQFEVLGEEVITLPKENRTNIRTNMELRSTSGATITLHDAPHPQGHLLQAELKDLRLSRLSGISFIPNLRGVVEANASWLQHHHKGNQDYHISAEVLNGYFNDVPVGDLKLQATVEERKAEGTYLTADANIDGVPVAELTSYQATGEEKRNRRLWLRAKELPLDKANPFLPSHYLNISGTVNAELANYNTKADIRQATTQKMQGQVTFKGAEVFVPLANEHYRLDERPLYIKEDNLILDNFRLTSNNSHLTSNGTVALGLPEYPLNIRLQGNDILLLNSSQTDDTQLFGTVQADANIRVTGSIRAFKLQGDVAIKGNTNVTFQDKEAELRQRNNLRGLVEFTDFTDTLFVAKTKAIDSLSLSGNDIRLNLHIDPAARVGFTFNNASTQVQASIQGGGDFNLKIPPYGAMNLSGTYSLSDGDVQVNLTVPPIAQHFNINQGSRIIWNGALLDPHIDFSATSKIRSQITQPDGPSRSVEFNVTLFIENQLDNLALRFHTSAPSDLALQNELATLSPEEQNRQSIMLLATKQYFGPGSGAGGQKGFDMSSTLTSMLASQFNSLAGDALNAEINLGIANTTNAYGTGTDYTYSIAKRFYNDRITLQVGGRVMTGQAATGMQQSFIDNMSLSYRLDQAGTHYLRLFHRRNFENLLDGEVIETGVGYLIRRRLNRLSQLFNFRKPKANPLPSLTPTTPPPRPMHLPLQPNKRSTLLLLLLLLLPSACSVSKYIPAGEHFYTGTKKITYAPNEANNQNREARKELESVLLYKPNNSLFGSPSSRLPITFPFYIHHTFAHSKNFLGKWLYRSFGSNPILISEVNPPLRATIGEQVLRENGYFSAHITPHVQLHGKDSVKASVSYQVALGTPHLLDSIRYLIPIQPTSLPLLYAPSHSLLQKGQPFSARLLAQERQRIATLLRSQGYYYFRPEYIIFQADTVQRPQKVQLRVKLSDEMLPEAYQPWQMGCITYNLYSNEDTLLPDSLLHDGILYRFNGKPPVKLHLLQPRIGIKQGALYSQAMEQSTIQRMAELNTFAYTDVSYTPRQEGGNNILDVNINSRLDLPYFTELEASYKFKSNNQTGPGASFSVNRKNLFHGGELLSILLRGSYEWETNRSSTQGNSWDINSYELGLQTSLTYPRLLIPFLTHRSFHFPHSSKVSLSGTLLNRANFYRQGQFTLDLSYRLEPTPSTRHTFTPISFSYNYIMHSTERFNEAIAQNPALALSFRNQFIPQFNYLFGYELQAPHSPHAFSLEAYIAEAGGLFSLAYLGSSKPKGEPHLFLGTPFAQFVKGTLELRYNYRANNRFQIATRAYAGAVISYGNMLVAPYLEQFYSGGANSIRGFNVRTLGPGSYRTQTTNPLDFLDRTGDLRLEANLELRYRLLGQLELATFIDVGNVWLLRPDPTRPNAHFSPQHLLNDAALGTGLGIRYDLNFLVLRFDTGLALHQPTRQGGKYFNTFLPGHKLPLAFHLAIGYPF